MIDNIDINKIDVSSKISSGNDFENFIGYRDAKQLDPYVYSFQKWVHIAEILIKLNVFLFNKRWKIIQKI